MHCCQQLKTYREELTGCLWHSKDYMGRVGFHLNTREEDFPCTHADLLKNDYFESEWNSHIFLGSFSKLHFTSTKTQPRVPCSAQLFSPKWNAKFKTKKHQKQHHINGSRAAIIKTTYICRNKSMFFHLERPTSPSLLPCLFFTFPLAEMKSPSSSFPSLLWMPNKTFKFCFLVSRKQPNFRQRCVLIHSEKQTHMDWLILQVPLLGPGTLWNPNNSA